MSIQVHELTKIYGEQKALDNVSFSIPEGEVVGFLGPNGAGKSTCMKILTAFIPPNAGRAEVAGHDVENESLELRQKVGYLPEHNPLYLDMYVKEFLHFIARIHQLDRPQLRVREMIGITGLDREENKKIGSLSKGYRQRVGLAQAMIHDPEVLILDEPTAGLDPNQLSEIRKLISDFGKNKTVLFSSHIMQEVQAICDRVIIINKGKIVADENIDLLSRNRDDTEVVRLKLKEAVSRKQLESIPEVKNLTVNGESYELVFDSNSGGVEKVFQWVNENRFTVLHLERKESSLEDIFQLLTKES
jgi:ABC-2 type transport system ATP-binding protein